MNIDLLKTHLKEGIVTVKFTKKDGSERVMKCTQQFDLIPTMQQPLPGTETTQHGEQVRVFDVEKQAWRSFNESSVISWEL